MIKLWSKTSDSNCLTVFRVLSGLGKLGKTGKMSTFSIRQGKPSQEKQEKRVECQEKVKKIFLHRLVGRRLIQIVVGNFKKWL